MYCQASPGLRDIALYEVEAELRRLRGLSSKEESNFTLSTSDSIIQQIDRVTALVRTGTLAISGLGLLVGGVGVMNIMLMSVTQRTREIGVRKAIGARRRDIVWQFLLEAALLTTIGGAGRLHGGISGTGPGLFCAEPAGHSTGVGGLLRPRCFDCGRNRFRPLARGQSRASRPRRVAPLRVASPLPLGFAKYFNTSVSPPAIILLLPHVRLWLSR